MTRHITIDIPLSAPNIQAVLERAMHAAYEEGFRRGRTVFLEEESSEPPTPREVQSYFADWLIYGPGAVVRRGES